MFFFSDRKMGARRVKNKKKKKKSIFCKLWVYGVYVAFLPVYDVVYGRSMRGLCLIDRELNVNILSVHVSNFTTP